MLLHSRIEGEGKPIVIIHGFLGMSDNWKTLGTQFANEGYQVHALDLRNHGKSFHADDFSYEIMVEDVKKYFEFHQLKDVLLLGHSMGGKVAMTFTLEHQEMVEKLIVVDISPRRYPGRNVHFDMIGAMMEVDFEHIHTREEVEKFLTERIPDQRIRLFVMKNLYRKTRHTLDWRLNLQAISSNMDYVFEGIDSNEVYKGAVLFIRGGKSDYITGTDTELIRKFFPSAIIQTIEGASHWVHADAPEELCRLFSGFLGKTCTAGEIETV